MAGEIPVYLRGNCQGALQPDVAVKASIILTSPRIYCICKVGAGHTAKIYTEAFLLISVAIVLHHTIANIVEHIQERANKYINRCVQCLSMENEHPEPALVSAPKRSKISNLSEH